MQKRILKGFEMFEYYANHQWEFRNERALNFRRKLNSEESRVFSIEAHDFDIRAYLEDCARGARLYLLKEPPSTLPAARRHLKVYVATLPSLHLKNAYLSFIRPPSPLYHYIYIFPLPLYYNFLKFSSYFLSTFCSFL